jgi:hypothetical protein
VQPVGRVRVHLVLESECVILAVSVHLVLESNEDITPSDIHSIPLANIEGPITRASVRQLTLEVNSFLNALLYVNLENDLVPNNLVVVRNMGEDVDKG